MIKILSNNTINKIAAGEVIERPASVVKELVENSIDAGASKIDIMLECAGKNLISVKDNGRGLSKEELALAIQRHATSKLDEDDLLNINSFGFRGEALPSIGAISRFKITSKTKESEHAYCLSVEASKVQPARICNGDFGTLIEVQDLFFATPARLKFLRTDRTELTAISQWVRKIALSHPQIAFCLSHDGKNILKLAAQIGSVTEQNMQKRVGAILGDNFIDNAQLVDFQQSNFSIKGYISLPTYNRASADEQYIFINNRPVKDKILNIALKVAYRDYLARDRHPVAILFLTIDPQQVDVNVHPAKSEVRFHDPNLVKSMVIDAVQAGLAASSDRVSTQPAQQAINYMQQNKDQSKYFAEKNMKNTNFNINSNQIVSKKAEPQSTSLRADYSTAQYSMPRGDNQKKFTYDHIIKETKQASLVETPPQSITIDEKINQKPKIESKEADYTENELAEPDHHRLGAAKAQLHNTYIISQSKDSIIITDQHAAHERIGYEKIKQKIAKDGLMKQRLLMPEIVEFQTSDQAEILAENKEKLAKLGMSIEKFGDKSIIVTEVPAIIGDVNIEKLVRDLADHFGFTGEDIALSELIEHVTETYACHYAVRAGRILTAHEMNELLRQMEATPFSGQCNHGRQTYVELKLKDIEKLFGRK